MSFVPNATCQYDIPRCLRTTSPSSSFEIRAAEPLQVLDHHGDFFLVQNRSLYSAFVSSMAIHYQLPLNTLCVPYFAHLLILPPRYPSPRSLQIPAEVLIDHIASPGDRALSLSRGDIVYILDYGCEVGSPWLIMSGTDSVGYIPASHVRPLSARYLLSLPFSL